MKSFQEFTDQEQPLDAASSFLNEDRKDMDIIAGAIHTELNDVISGKIPLYDFKQNIINAYHQMAATRLNMKTMTEFASDWDKIININIKYLNDISSILKNAKS